MDYVIVSANNKNYIHLNTNGAPEPCSKANMQRFEYSKAYNILTSLPKVLRKFGFKVIAAPEMSEEENGEKENTSNDIGREENLSGVILEKPTKDDSFKSDETRKSIVSENIELSPEILKWEERVNSSNTLIEDARKRKEELERNLSNIDRKISDIEHEIELEGWKSGVAGYKYYKAIKTALEIRRPIKDELCVVRLIANCNRVEHIPVKQVSRTIEGLKVRRYDYRICSETEEKECMER